MPKAQSAGGDGTSYQTTRGTAHPVMVPLVTRMFVEGLQVCIPREGLDTIEKTVTWEMILSVATYSLDLRRHKGQREPRRSFWRHFHQM